MSHIDAILLAVTLVLVIGAIAAGGFLASRNGAFWASFVGAIAAAAWPKIVEYITKRNTPEVEAQMARCIRMGGEWDNFNKKCKFK